MTIILNDDHLKDRSFMSIAINALERAFILHTAGETVSPPRHHVSFGPHGDLVFTVGGTLGETPLAGFRVYDTFAGSEHTQIVAVWSANDAKLKGLILGERLGAIRTGAIGGVAIKHLSAPEARTVGVIGSGLQARTQLAAAASVRDITLAKVYSRDETNRSAFAQDMQADLGIEVQAVASVQDAVSDADIVICATSSSRPVISATVLKPGAHINTVGPKTLEAHELGHDVADLANTIATDSIAQTQAYASPFFLHGSRNEQRVLELSAIVAGLSPGRTSAEDITLFCSVGLAGTEVAVASAIFDSL